MTRSLNARDEEEESRKDLFDKNSFKFNQLYALIIINIIWKKMIIEYICKKIN